MESSVSAFTLNWPHAHNIVFSLEDQAFDRAHRCVVACDTFCATYPSLDSVKNWMSTFGS